MAFKTPDLVSYFEQAQAEGQSPASIISSLFGVVAGGIAASKAKAAPIPYAPGVKPTPEPQPLMPGLVAGLTPSPMMKPQPIIPPTKVKPMLESLVQTVIGAGCKVNPITGAYT